MTLLKSNSGIMPFGFNDVFDIERFFNNNLPENGFNQTLPAVNIKENKKEFNIEFAAPGFTKKDFKIDVDQDVLTISAEKEHEENEETESYSRKEFSYNSFSRSFSLPNTVSGEKIDARYDDGILKLSVPKKAASKALPKKEIKIA
ncbi:Hsp20/alpha crystallin family protein [Flavobacterium sp.]|jgi:HSP20 family protein|uniref:Hsp20/alpha crystallin family protein n=1 Tax=Flavobacterium sp. TaxID=239 RepID=UPI0037BE8504|eukprot:gene1897-2680_t